MVVTSNLGMLMLLYPIFISNGSKNNKWVSHRLGVWGSGLPESHIGRPPLSILLTKKKKKKFGNAHEIGAVEASFNWIVVT